MPVKTTLTSITKDGFSEIYQFWQDAGLSLYDFAEERDRFNHMLNLHPDLCFKLLDDKNQLIGTVMGAFDGRNASIHRLAILPSLQRQGLGKKLVKKLEAAFKSKGIKKFIAQVHVNNTQVVPFYEKLGFKEMTYVKNYFKDL